MMDPRTIQSYYNNPQILEKILSLCKEREVVPSYLMDEKDGAKFGSRPSIIQFKGDVEFFVKQGTTSFHASIEHWSNPMLLKSGMRKAEFDRLRNAWDIIIDIDSEHGLEYAKKTAMLLIQTLKMHGIKNISIKFSGRRGFHIGLSHKTLPSTINAKPVAQQYPELLQRITAYLKNFIKTKLAEQLATLDPKLKEKDANPYEAVHVEENWGPRHLFRMPYSFNEKTWLVSLPIELRQIATFKPEDAAPEKVLEAAEKGQLLGFLDGGEENEAKDLVLQALDWYSKQEEKKVEETVKRDFKRTTLTKALPESFFPPCMKLILAGIKDGRKRAVFAMINFLRTVGWNWEEIEKRLLEWNQKNPDPLREVYITTQLNYARKKSVETKEIIPPPNCDNKMYYKDIGICKPDNLCAKIKNPASYSLRFLRMSEAEAREKRKK